MEAWYRTKYYVNNRTIYDLKEENFFPSKWIWKKQGQWEKFVLSTRSHETKCVESTTRSHRKLKPRMRRLKEIKLTYIDNNLCDLSFLISKSLSIELVILHRVPHRICSKKILKLQCNYMCPIAWNSFCLGLLSLCNY